MQQVHSMLFVYREEIPTHMRDKPTLYLYGMWLCWLPWESHPDLLMGLPTAVTSLPFFMPYILQPPLSVSPLWFGMGSQLTLLSTLQSDTDVRYIILRYIETI